MGGVFELKYPSNFILVCSQFLYNKLADRNMDLVDSMF